MFSQFFEIGDNKVAFTITIILVLLIALLIVSMFSKSIEKALRTLRILEDKENPRELLIWIFGIMITIRIIHVFIVQPFIVDGDSMYPQLHNGEILLIDKVSYKLHTPKVGDIIVFKYHDPYHKCLDGGYAAVTTSSVDKAVETNTYVNMSEICRTYATDPYDNKYLVKRIVALPSSTTTYEGKKLVAGPDQYIVMGDNRPESYDSRSWGALDSKYISGRVSLRILPISAFKWNPAPMLDPINLK